MDNELERLRRRSEMALARAWAEHESRPRQRLLSSDDIEELTGRTVALIEEHMPASSNTVEIETPKGYRARGSAWPIVVIVLAIAATLLTLRLLPAK
jgi:hypothetical protein